MSDTVSYKIPASATLSQDLIPNSKNKLLPGKTYAYEYLVAVRPATPQTLALTSFPAPRKTG